MSADDLVLGGKTQFSGEVVFGLGAAGVDGLLGLAVAIVGKEREQLKRASNDTTRERSTRIQIRIRCGRIVVLANRTINKSKRHQPPHINRNSNSSIKLPCLQFTADFNLTIVVRTGRDQSIGRYKQDCARAATPPPRGGNR